MIECPRCGFLQPKDRYCANCGIDIENYKPKPKPLYVRLLNSPFFYLAGIICVDVLVFFIYQRTAQNSASEQIQTFQASKSESDNNNSTPKPIKTRKPPVNYRHNEDNQMATVAAQKKALKELEKDNKKKVEKKVMAPKLPEKMTVSFFELSRAAMTELYAKSQVASEGPDYQALYFNTSTPKNELGKLDPSLEPLPGGRSEFMKANTSIGFNYPAGSNTGGAEWGLSFKMNIGEITRVSTSFEFLADIIIHTGEREPPYTSNFESNFKLNNKKSLLILGVLPKQKLPKAQLSRVQATPLSILDSDYFVGSNQERQTEFLMVVQVN